MKIPEICRSTGYVFPEGIVEGTVINAYRIRVKSTDYEGEAILSEKYLPKGMKPEKGESIKELVVINFRDDKLFVAKDRYFDKLMAYFYTFDKRYVKRIRYPHWEAAWKTDFSKEDYQPENIRLIERKKENDRQWFEVAGTKCRIPVQVTPEVLHLSGESDFFPATLYNYSLLRVKKRNSKRIPPPNNNDKWMFPRCIYKTEDSDIPKPCCFNGEIQLKNTKNNIRQVHIFLHGFIFPCKWHYDVLKHMLCAPKFRKNDDRELWEAFEGKEIGSFDMRKIEECRENKDQTSCDEIYCNKNGLFEKVHPELKDYCRRYLEKAVSFFGKDTEKEIRIWESKDKDRKFNIPKFIETDCRNEVKISDMARQLGMKGPERMEILILRGYSYDWESAEEPTVHLYPLTLYAGKLDGSSGRPDLENYKLIHDGNLNIL